MRQAEFWMVYGLNQGTPAVRHMSVEIATAEAKRLASLNPGVEFFVMQPIGSAKKIDVEYEEFDVIPF